MVPAHRGLPGPQASVADGTLMDRCVVVETLVGRKQELQRLHLAVQRRESRLVWGAAHSGKTALVEAMIAELAEDDRRSCVCWTGPASRRQLLLHLVGRLYETGNPFVRKKVHADRETKLPLSRWLGKQSSLRLRGILFSALAQTNCRLFLDQFPPATRDMARLMKEIIYRCKTPIYLAGRGYSQKEIGYAWSLYWNDGLRLYVGPLPDRDARDLLEACIYRFSLNSFDLEGFRDELLRLSGYLPGSIVKMCALAANPLYQDRHRIKMKLVHVDYLMQTGPSIFPQSTNSLP